MCSVYSLPVCEILKNQRGRPKESKVVYQTTCHTTLPFGISLFTYIPTCPQVLSILYRFALCGTLRSGMVFGHWPLVIDPHAQAKQHSSVGSHHFRYLPKLKRRTQVQFKCWQPALCRDVCQRRRWMCPRRYTSDGLRNCVTCKFLYS